MISGRRLISRNPGQMHHSVGPYNGLNHIRLNAFHSSLRISNWYTKKCRSKKKWTRRESNPGPLQDPLHMRMERYTPKPQARLIGICFTSINYVTFYLTKVPVSGRRLGSSNSGCSAIWDWSATATAVYCWHCLRKPMGIGIKTCKIGSKELPTDYIDAVNVTLLDEAVVYVYWVWPDILFFYLISVTWVITTLVVRSYRFNGWDMHMPYT